MSVKAKSVSRGGFWDSSKNTYSPETQKLLKEMMKESKLTNLQQQRLQESVRNGDALPLHCAPNGGELEKQDSDFGSKKVSRKALNATLLVGGKRSKDTIEAMGAYNLSTYRPHPFTRSQEKEKLKLANIMAFGKDMEPMKIKQPRPKLEEPKEEIDRFEELQSEIEDRHAFLQDMELLGEGKRYRTIIQTEISQKIREMELIDKRRTLELEKLRAEKEKLQPQQKSPIPEDLTKS